MSEAAGAGAPPPAAAISAGAAVLVLSGDESERGAVVRALDGLGLAMLEAAGLDEAREALGRHDVAVLVVDVGGSSATDLAGHLREAGRGDAAPVVFLTSAHEETASLLDPGADAVGPRRATDTVPRAWTAIDVIDKPVDPRRLRRAVAVLAELSRQRRLLSAQAEELDKVRGAFRIFTGALGHDLRNPLNAIRLAGETLLVARPDDEIARTIGERVRSASHRLNHLIAQVLDFAALSGGTWPLYPRDADLGELCASAAAEFDQLAGRPLCTVEGDTRGAWDPDRLVQALSILIGNALQHEGAAAGIAVRIDGRTADAVMVELEHGGLLPEPLRSDPFGDRPPGQAMGATAIGLHLVAHIVRSHGGTAEARPEQGRTLVRIRLPRHGAPGR